MDNTQLIQMLQQLAMKAQQGAQQGSMMPQAQMPQLPQMQQPQAGGHLFSGNNSLWNTINDRRNASQLPNAYNGQTPEMNTRAPGDPNQGGMLDFGGGGGVKEQIKKGLISRIFSLFE